MDILLSLLMFLFGQTIQTRANTTTQYETVKQAVCREFKNECPLALAVFRAESGLVPTKEGDSGQSIGIAQIHLPAHSKKIPAKDKKAWLKNFQNNLRLAKQIRDQSGWYPWTAYKTGAYKVFLNSNI